MASYLQIENISKSYGPKVLFENIGFNINEGDKIALVAPNGTGKTSLMRILAGKDKSDSGGKILFLKDIRIAFLEQEYDFDPDKTVLDQALGGLRDFTSPADEESRGGYELRVKQFLSSLGISDHLARMKDLSGGEVKRVAIAQMLSREADFYIMDEPTNHLDIDAIEYLEQYFSRARCTLLMVTHDRYFLDRVCNIVMEMDRGAVYCYRGNYRNYLEKREERIANYNAETDKVRNILRRELEWMRSTPCARSGKARYRIDAFHRLNERASQEYGSKSVDMSTLKQKSQSGWSSGSQLANRLGNKIIDCRNVSFHYGERCLLDRFSYNFQRGDRLGIVGRNGVGKSTFIDLLTGDLERMLRDGVMEGRLEGVVERGESLKIGYYRQSGIEFNGDDRVMDIVNDAGLLNRFLFPRDMLNNRVATLSGGEKRRLYLLTVLMRQPNLLILDEPTNDLDIVTLNILEEYLQEYQGSLIIVTHDRHFLDRIADHLFVFCGDGVIKDFIGSYSEYREYIREYEAGQRRAGREEEKAAKAAAAKAGGKEAERAGTGSDTTGNAVNAAGAALSKRKMTYKEKREMEALEEETEALNREKAELEAALSTGSLDYEALEKASSRVGEIISLLDEKEMRLLELYDL